MRTRAGEKSPLPALGRKAEERDGVAGASGAAPDVDGGTDIPVAARGGLLNLVGWALGGGFNLLLVFVVAGALGAGRAGVFFQATALFLIVSTVSECGGGIGLVRTISRYRVLSGARAVRRVLWISFPPALVLSAAAAAALFLLATQLGELLVGPEHRREFVRYARILLPFLPLSVSASLLLAATRGFGTMAPGVFVEKLGRGLLQLLFVILAMLAGLGTAGVALAWAVPIGLSVLPATLWLGVLVRSLKDEPSPAVATPSPKRVAGEFWRFAGPRALAHVFKTGVDKVDILLVGALASSQAAGVYTAATRLAVAGNVVGVAIGQALSPIIGGLLAAGHLRRAGVAYQVATGWIVTIAWPVLLTAVVSGPFVLSLIGPEFAAGATALFVVALALLVSAAAGPVDTVLLMSGRSVWSMTNMLLALAVNVGLNLVLIPKFGVAGAGAAWAASIVLINLAALVQVRLLIGIHPFGKGALTASVAALMCFGIAPVVFWGIWDRSVWTWALAHVAGTLTYFGLIWRWRQALELRALRDAVRLRLERSPATGRAGIGPIPGAAPRSALAETR